MSESHSLLQRFFDASLIPSETTDERLKHYQAAASDLSKRFSATPRDAASASRVAIDPNCPATDPWFSTVQDAVKAHWKTFLVKNHDAPRQICRAILIESLSKAATEDWTVTLATWNAASNLLPHLGNGPEQAITREFIIALGKECESQSSEEWSINASAAKNIPEFEIKLPIIKAPEVDEEYLKKGFSDAAGPSNNSGRTNGNPNSTWPQNNPGQWAGQFGDRAGNTVASALSKVVAEISPAIEGLHKQFTPSLKKHANGLVKWVIESTQHSERFTALLWWKQALYSPTLQCSYRILPPAAAALALSFDLGNVSGAPVPLSVEYFLRETVRSLFPENPTLTAAELIAAIKSSDEIILCLPIAPSGSARRVSLREFMSAARQEALTDEAFQCYVGIMPTTSLPISEWAVWLLREHLAEMLTATRA